jgi:hypothetical protein
MRPLARSPTKGSAMRIGRFFHLTFVLVALLALAPASARADADGPEAHIVAPVDGAMYPQGAKDQFAFYCSSATSFVVSCEGSQPLGSLLDTTTAGTHTLSVTATDYEGRTSTTTATYTVLDVTPPHVNFRLPADGATYDLGADLTYDYGCEDDPGGLGIQACIATLPSGAPFDTHRLGTFTFDVYAVDWANNVTHQSVTYTIADRTPPSITLDTPADGATYTLGQQILARYSCDDGPNGSGLNGCKGDLGSGSPLDTTSLGTRTFSVSAYDRAGNEAQVTHSYSVVYAFSGFASPAAPYPTAAPAKAGESVPLKFSLSGDQGLDAVTGATWALCGTGDAAPATGTLSYNRSADRYTYLAATAKAWAGTCRDVTLTLRDGTRHQARFAFGK